jgi:hypothetical protein
MKYSIMIWMNGPGSWATGPNDEAGAKAPSSLEARHTGTLTQPPIRQIVYEVYDDKDEADAALELISSSLAENRPLRVTRWEDRSFVIPASSVHYVACQAVETA